MKFFCNFTVILTSSCCLLAQMPSISNEGTQDRKKGYSNLNFSPSSCDQALKSNHVHYCFLKASELTQKNSEEGSDKTPWKMVEETTLALALIVGSERELGSEEQDRRNTIEGTDLTSSSTSADYGVENNVLKSSGETIEELDENILKKIENAEALGLFTERNSEDYLDLEEVETEISPLSRAKNEVKLLRSELQWAQQDRDKKQASFQAVPIYQRTKKSEAKAAAHQAELKYKEIKESLEIALGKARQIGLEMMKEAMLERAQQVKIERECVKERIKNEQLKAVECEQKRIAALTPMERMKELEVEVKGLQEKLQTVKTIYTQQQNELNNIAFYKSQEKTVMESVLKNTALRRQQIQNTLKEKESQLKLAELKQAEFKRSQEKMMKETPLDNNSASVTVQIPYSQTEQLNASISETTAHLVQMPLLQEVGSERLPAPIVAQQKRISKLTHEQRIVVAQQKIQTAQEEVRRLEAIWMVIPFYEFNSKGKAEASVAKARCACMNIEREVQEEIHAIEFEIAPEEVQRRHQEVQRKHHETIKTLSIARDELIKSLTEMYLFAKAEYLNLGDIASAYQTCHKFKAEHEHLRKRFIAIEQMYTQCINKRKEYGANFSCEEELHLHPFSRLDSKEVLSSSEFPRNSEERQLFIERQSKLLESQSKLLEKQSKDLNEHLYFFQQQAQNLQRDPYLAKVEQVRKSEDIWSRATKRLHQAHWKRQEALRNIGILRREGYYLDESNGSPRLSSNGEELEKKADLTNLEAIEAAEKFEILRRVPDCLPEMMKLEQGRLKTLTLREREDQIFNIVRVNASNITEEEKDIEAKLTFEERTERARREFNQALRELDQAKQEREKALSNLQHGRWYCENYGRLLEMNDPVELWYRVDQATPGLIEAAKRFEALKMALLPSEQWKTEMKRIITLTSQERTEELLKVAIPPKEWAIAREEKNDPFIWSLKIIADTAAINRKWDNTYHSSSGSSGSGSLMNKKAYWDRVQQEEQEEQERQRKQNAENAKKAGLFLLKAVAGAI